MKIFLVLSTTNLTSEPTFQSAFSSREVAEAFCKEYQGYLSHLFVEEYVVDSEGDGLGVKKVDHVVATS